MDPFGSLRIMFLNAENKMHRITKETNYIEINLSNVKTIVIYCGLFPTFQVEGNAKYQLEVSENKDVIFFPSQFTDPLKSIHEPPRGSWTPG
jgi:hypothetical protein